MTLEQQHQIHNILYKHCYEFIPVQEITYAANEIIKNPTKETIDNMIKYLNKFDKQFIPLQTIDCKSIINNQIKFAISEITKEVEKFLSTTTLSIDKDSTDDKNKNGSAS